MSSDELARAVELLTNQVRHWTPSRWAAHADHGTRADLVHALVQRVADLAADAEGEPRRPVPRLENDLVLPDQIRVVVADLCAASASAAVLTAAAADVTATRHAL